MEASGVKEQKGCVLKSAIVALVMGAQAMLNAQTGDSPAFEVASIKPAEPLGGRGGGGPIAISAPRSDPGYFTCPSCNIFQLVLRAYDIPAYRVSGIQNIFDDPRYIVNAKIPEGSTKEQVAVMLQNLLAERFHLKVHRETKEMTGYELGIAKGGIKMKVSPPDDPAGTAPVDGQGSAPPPPRPLPPPGSLRTGADGLPELPKGRGNIILMTPAGAKMHAEKESTEKLTQFLEQQMGGPVTDSTGLKDKYDFDLTWDPSSTSGRGGGFGLTLTFGPPPAAPAGPGGNPLDGAAIQRDPQPTMLAALPSQLGLKLDKKTVTVEIVVVDHYEKTPTEN